jgi:ceramide glucosyltransferase
MMESAVLAGAGALWVAALGWLAGTACLALLQPLRRRAAPSPAQLPPVSIVVPTSIVESSRSKVDRTAALASLLELEAPQSEIMICIDRGEPHGALVEELRRAFPTDRVRVVVAAEQSSANAKVDAMAGGVRAARHDFVLFSDDDVLLDRLHLARLAAQWGHDVGLVSAAAVGTAPENLWGELELAFMNSQFARLHLAGDFLGMGGVLGKSILVRRADLERAGGLLPTGRDCCEDAALTRNFAAVGLRTLLGDRPVHQPIGRQDFIEVWRRHRRWLSCRRKYIPATFACEALFSAPVACLAGAVACAGVGCAPMMGALATAALWCVIDCLFILANRWHFGPLTPLAWLVRELIFLPLWTSALFARTVEWYGRRVPVAD